MKKIITFVVALSAAFVLPGIFAGETNGAANQSEPVVICATGTNFIVEGDSMAPIEIKTGEKTFVVPPSEGKSWAQSDGGIGSISVEMQ